MKSTIPLGRIAGIKVGIHFSWFFILAVVTWSLAEVVFPSLNSEFSTIQSWFLGFVSAILLFVSVLIHELAHSIVAKSKGFPVEGITLFFLGGVSSLRAEARHAKDELIISAVGPATSLGLGLFFILLLTIIGGDIDSATPITPAVEPVTPIEAILGYLGFINILLAIFNMLPAFPLDGGRVLRSIIWGVTGSFGQATRIAARGGQFFGLMMIAIGVIRIVALGDWGGLWFALIGWFLHSAAGSSLREMEFEAIMRGIQVRDVMRREPPTIHPNATIHETVYERFLKDGIRALPVCDEDRLVGIISLTDVKEVPREKWSSVRVNEEMTPVPLKSVTPNDELSHALDLLAENSLHQAPVIEGESIVGLLTRADIIEHIHRRKELGIESEVVVTNQANS